MLERIGTSELRGSEVALEQSSSEVRGLEFLSGNQVGPKLLGL